MKQDYKFVPKGWGFEKWLCNNEKYCGKLLFIAKGKKISWHYHEKKDEHFYVHKGKLVVVYSYEKDIEKAYQSPLNQGDVFHVPIGMVHRLIALEDSEVFEFSTQHFDEDSIRIEKGD
jgi:quercetin dioxygenase-like cupin family protein